MLLLLAGSFSQNQLRSSFSAHESVGMHLLSYRILPLIRGFPPTSTFCALSVCFYNQRDAEPFDKRGFPSQNYGVGLTKSTFTPVEVAPNS